MKDEKEQGGKTPPKKPQGNGRGAQPVQGRGRTTRPVRRSDVDIPGPGEPEVKRQTPPPEAAGEAAETPAARRKGTAPKAKPAAGEGAPRPAKEGAPAAPAEEPTVRFQKGQVPVKGPKPPAQRGEGAAKQGAVRGSRADSTRPKEVPADNGGGAQRSARPKEAPAGNGRGAQRSARPVPPPPPPKEPEGPEEKGRPRYTGGKLVLYRSYILLTILSAIIVVGYVGFRLFAAPPAVKPPVTSRPPVVITTTDPSGNPVEVVQPDILSSDRKQEFYTFLLVGESQETGGGLTDTMLLVSYDVPNQKLSIMSLPRDIYVSKSGRLLNSVYTSAGGGEKGMTALREQVQKLTGVYPDFGVSLKWEAVGELVDAIGGVWFDVPRRMFYWDRSQNFKIDVQKGYQCLDGNDAMGVIRWRQNTDEVGNVLNVGYPEGDLGRIKTQQAFLKALISQCLQMDKLIDNLGSYIDIFQRNVTTELTVGNLTYFATNALTGLDMDNVTFTTLPNKSPYEGCDHLVGVPREIVVTVNQYFNPYKTDIHLGELDVVTDMARPTPKPTATPEPSEKPGEEEPPESPEPTESKTPGDDPLIPPEASLPPNSSPAPSNRPGESEPPEASPTPAPTAAPEPTPEPTPVPTEEPPAPIATEEPQVLLPPGA